MIVTLFEPIVRNIWQLFSHILGRAASQKESIARLTAQGKASRLMAGSLVWGLRSASMPPCWSRRIVAQYICGHRARRIMRTYHAVSQGRNWTRSAQPDAANTEGTLIEASHPAAPRASAQADGAAERSRPANVCSVRRLARAATAVLGANIPRARRSGDARVHARRARLPRC
jgi:hypothetical protein